MEQKVGIINKNLIMQYSLPERIGNPDMLTGRKKEFHEYHRWISEIPGMLSRSRVILARRKTGKTAFVQHPIISIAVLSSFMHETRHTFEN
jgi:hypothetical protein